MTTVYMVCNVALCLLSHCYVCFVIIFNIVTSLGEEETCYYLFSDYSEFSSGLGSCMFTQSVHNLILV